MNRNKVVTSVTLFAIALGLSASIAKAEEATFNLPFQARWGRAVLEPGAYTLSMPTTVSGIQVFTLTGNGKTVMFAPAGISYGTQSARSYLELVNKDGMYVVRDYTSGLTGQTFRFSLPKAGANDKGGKATAVAVTQSR